jgi:putative ABC transport system permease protein
MRLLDWRVVGQLFLKASSLQRKRATLTVAAIAWGTVAIIMLLSFGEGLKIQLMKGRRGMGENIAVWWPDETSKVWQGLPEGRPIRPRMDDIDYLRGRMTAASGVIGEITSHDHRTGHRRPLGVRRDPPPLSPVGWSLHQCPRRAR